MLVKYLLHRSVLSTQIRRTINTMNHNGKRKQLLCLALLVSVSSLAACSSSDTTSSEPTGTGAISQDPRDYATCADDNIKYKGISCFGVPLGISLGKFREILASQSAISEQPTKFPSILRKYSIRSFPDSSIPWSAAAHFVIDEDCYRLYTIDGFSTKSTEELVQYFSKKHGRPRREGIAYIWSKNGTKLRVLEGDQPLISFTHDKFVDLSSEKMAEAMERGDYLH